MSLSFTVIPPPSFDLVPVTPEDFAQNLRAARARAAQTLRLSGIVQGTREEFAALSPADQVRLTDETMAFIAANPGFFTARQNEIATRAVRSPAFRTPLVDTSIAASAGEFFTDFAGRVETKLTGLVALAIVAALAFTLLPAALAKARAAA